MRKIYLLLMAVLFTVTGMMGQTTLISPTGDGGFETGSTPAANNWTAYNSSTDGWFVGVVPVVSAGTNCGYISSTAGAAWTYSQTSTIQHLSYTVTLPAGESIATLNFKWKVGGEGTTSSDWDNMKVFFVPTSVAAPVANTAVSSTYQFSGPGAISGMYKLSSAAYNAETIVLTGTPGTSYRLIFSWKSDGTTIANPPAAIDEVSLVSRAPGTFTSIATGNFGSATTWDANAVPSLGDNIIVANTHTVTINATGQGANNVTVNTGGTLAYGTTPTSFTVSGNLDVAGTFNCFNGTTGKTLVARGNITNTGTIDLSKTSSLLQLTGTTPQTVSGAGTFTANTIVGLTFNNTATTYPSITWGVNNITVSGTNTFTAGRVAITGNWLSCGTAAAAGTLSYTSGGIMSGTYGRGFAAASTGSTITASSDPTTVTSRYPFITSAGIGRSAWIERTTPTGAGIIGITYVESAGVTTGLSIVDGAYTANVRSNDNWAVSVLAGTAAATSYELAIVASGVYGVTPPDATTRVTLANSVVGTHQAGTATPTGQRVLTLAQLPNTYYLAMAIPVCSGTPVGGTTTASVTSFCLGTPSSSNLALTGASVGQLGLSYQWESAPLGGSFTPISGATSTTYAATGIAVSTEFRCVITCSNSGLTVTSTAVSVIGYNCGYNVVRNSATPLTPINTSGTGFTGFSESDDAYSNATNIGFPFVYKGQTFTQLLVNTNGFIALGSTAPTNPASSWVNNLSNASHPPNIIAPLWDDWVTQGNAGAASVPNFIKWKLDGISPNRILTIEWFGMERFQYAGPNINFQAKLYEGSNNIEFIYGNMLMFDGTGGSTPSANTYSIGLTGLSTQTGLEKVMVLQRENSACFNVTDPTNTVSLGTSVECNTSYLFTPGTYTACTPPALGIPANDNAAGAITLTVNASPCTDLCGTYYNTVNATASPTTSSCTTAPDDDVWFQFIASTSSQTITVRSASAFDAVVSLLDNSLTEVSGFGCVNVTAVGLTETINATGLTAGSVYYVRVSHNGTGSGNNNGFSICVNQVVVPPSNDDPCGAYNLTVGNGTCTPYEDNPASLPSKTAFIAATNTTTNGVTTPGCTGAGATVQDVWFSFTATDASQIVTVTPKTGTNAAFQLYSSTGTCGGSNLALTSVSCINTASTGGVETNTFTGLTVGNVYYVRVYAHPSGQGGAPSSNSQFSVCVNSLPVPLCTTNSIPANTAINVSATPTLTWSAATNATSYDVYIGTPDLAAAQAATPVNVTTTSYTVPSALANSTIYYWFVVPKNNTGTPTGCSANATSFTTSAPTPSCTTNISPANTATSVTSPATLTWNADAFATSYDVYLGTANPPTTLIGNVTTTSTNVTLSNGNTVYYWYVKPKNGSGSAIGCDVSSVTSFTSAPMACVPTVSTPPCSAGGGDSLTIFKLVGENATLIDNNSGPSCGTTSSAYSDYTSLPAVDLAAGKAYAGKMTVGNYTIAATIWIDFNDNLVFEANEKLLEKLTVDVLTSSTIGKPFSIYIPAGSATGIHRMRVRATGTAQVSPIDPCTSSTYGETEDYKVNIIASGTPYTLSNPSVNVCNQLAFTTINAVSNNNDVDLPILDKDGNLVATIDANTNNLDLVTSSLYYNSGAVRQNGGTFYLDRNYTITPATPPTSNVDVRLYYNEAERLALENAQVGSSPLAPASINCTKNSQACGGVFTPNLAGEVLLTPTTTSTYGANGLYNTYSISSFSTFWLHVSQPTSTLPVSISNIRGEVTGATNTVYWTTATEANNRKFVVERSVNGNNFTAIGEVATRAINGNSNTALQYSFVDANPVQGKAFYRLQMVDNNARATYSQIVTLRRGAGKLEIVDVRPNPTTGNIYFNLLGVNNNSQFTLTLRTVEGKAVLVKNNFTPLGSGVIDMSKLANGMYILEAVDVRNNEKAVFKVVKQ